MAGSDGDGESGKVAVNDGGSSVAVVGGIGDLAVGSAERHSISNFLFSLSCLFDEGSFDLLVQNNSVALGDLDGLDERAR